MVLLYLLNDGVALVVLLLHQTERMDKAMLPLQAEGIGAIQHAYYVSNFCCRFCFQICGEWNFLVLYQGVGVVVARSIHQLIWVDIETRIQVPLFADALGI